MKIVTAQLIDSVPESVLSDLKNEIPDGLQMMGAYFVSDDRCTEDYNWKITLKSVQKQYLPRWEWVPKWLAKVPFFGYTYYGVDLKDVDAGWVIVVESKQ